MHSFAMLTFPERVFRECLDPFDTPECEAFDLFVNELLCLGKGTTLFINGKLDSGD